MKKFVIIFFFLLWGTNAYSQYVHYGLPDVSFSIEKGDVLITNIPRFFLNGGYNFVNLEEFDDLVELLEFYDTNIFRIEVNNFFGSDSLICEFISNRLCNNIEETLKSKTTMKNYYLVSNGSKNPLLCKDKDYLLYIYINTRLEIIVE
jgi:hypothetical protein